ncbi:DNA ligase [Bienertia sinuspersici]
MMDGQKVLAGGSWSFKGSPLLLKEVEQDVQPSEITFDIIQFLVKAYDVPLNKRTKSMAISMASKMGKFVEYDDSDPLGHFYPSFVHYDDLVAEGELPYGAWLRPLLLREGGFLIRKKRREFAKLSKAHQRRVKVEKLNGLADVRIPKRGRVDGLVVKAPTFDVPMFDVHSILEMDKVMNKLGYHDGHFVDAQGKSVGLAMLWREWVSVDIISTSSHHIDVVRGVFGDKEWKLTGFCGDQRKLDDSRDALDECGLQDIGYVGDLFTWWNKPAIPNDVMERLYFGVANVGWHNLFPNLEVCHLAFDASNSKPIKLTKLPIVRDASSEQDGEVSRVDVVKKIQAFRNKIVEVDMLELTEHMVSKRKELSLEPDKLLYAEELMWRQRSRICDLREGDQNTSYFHMKASRRRRRNAIKIFHDDDGRVVMEQQEIE